MHDNKHQGYRPTVAGGRPAPYAREALVISLLYWGPVRTVRPVRCFYGPSINHHHSPSTTKPWKMVINKANKTYWNQVLDGTCCADKTQTAENYSLIHIFLTYSQTKQQINHNK